MEKIKRKPLSHFKINFNSWERVNKRAETNLSLSNNWCSRRLIKMREIYHQNAKTCLSIFTIWSINCMKQTVLYIKTSFHPYCNSHYKSYSIINTCSKAKCVISSPLVAPNIIYKILFNMNNMFYKCVI